MTAENKTPVLDEQGEKVRDELLSLEVFPQREHLAFISERPSELVHYSLEGVEAINRGAEAFAEWKDFIATRYAQKFVQEGGIPDD